MKRDLNPKVQFTYDELITIINQQVLCNFYQIQMISMIDELLEEQDKAFNKELENYKNFMDYVYFVKSTINNCIKLLDQDGINSKALVKNQLRYLLINEVKNV